MYYLKDILDASRKDISTALHFVEEQCLILRPDLYATEGSEVLDSWVRHQICYMFKYSFSY